MGAPLPLGTVRVGHANEPLVKVAEHPSRKGRQDNWVAARPHFWEMAHGEKVPEGYNVVSIDRDPANLDPDNLEIVPHGYFAVMGRLGITWHDRDSLDACIATVRLVMAANDLEDEMPRRCTSCGATFTMRELDTDYRQGPQTRPRLCPGCKKTWMREHNREGYR